MEKRIRILLVEDDQIDRMAFERFVKHEGLPYDCATASSVAKARESLVGARFDAVLIDYLLGDGTALDLLGEIKDSPTIVITGGGDEEIAVKAMKAGACDYLVKDPEGNYLKIVPVTVEGAIRRKRDEEELRRYRQQLEALVEERTAELTRANKQLAAEIAERRRAETELAEEHNLLRTLIDSLPDYIYAKDTEGRLFLGNIAVAREVGVTTPDEVIGKTDFDFFPEELAAQYRADEEAMFRSGQPLVNREELVIDHAGNRSWVLATKVPLRNSQGQIVGLVGMNRDITERKRTEAEISRLAAVIEQATETIVITDLDGNIVYANPYFETSTGYSVAEALGQNLRILKSGHQDQPFYQELWETIARGETWQGVFINRHRDGGLYHEGATIFPIQDLSGKTTHYAAVKRNITVRVQAEGERELLLAQIREQAKQIQQTIDTVPEGVLLLDTAQRVMLANPVAKGALAVLAEAKVGDTLTRLGDRPLAELLTSPPTTGLWHEVNAVGRTFEVIARPMANGPGPENWVLVIRDVTSEREAQQRLQQQERLAAVGQLAAGIAHDFNNIMSVIVLYTRMGLRLPDIPAQLRNRLETVDQQAKRATDLIQQILDFSRRAVLELRPMDLTPFLKEVVKLLERTVLENVRINLNYGEDEYTVNADPTRMQQAIMNLAVNARDAMPEGGGLRIALSRTAETDEIRCVTCGQVLGGEWVRITVTDTGSGIPPDVLSHIFEPFFTTKEIGEGTGLGLAQVYGIVKQHEGHVDVSTKVGEGTTFIVYLPALLKHQPEAPVKETRAFVQGQGETILVVEDDANLREALVYSVELLNYRVLEATNGQAALDILEQRASEIALVLSDLVMPKMGGQALFHAMRQRGLTLPVVMLSGHPMEDKLEGLQRQGLAGWMLKPPNMEQLAQLLARALREGSE